MNWDKIYEKLRDILGHEGVAALFLLCALISIYSIVEG
jgi:hypothetical protein